jgi:cysteine desulfurase
MARVEAAGLFANPASVHAAGRAARAELELAREQVASAIGAAGPDLVLTSGGTEACNLGVLGLLARAAPGAEVVTTAVEHPAVAEPLAWLEAAGRVRVSRLPVPEGIPPAPEALAERITADTALVAIQWVNHETGTCFDVPGYAQVCARKGVPLFVDATQALGKLPLRLLPEGVAALALASTKIGGPAGAGALWVRRGVALEPLLRGGAQERGRRAGSPGLGNLAGFGAACAALPDRLGAQPRLAELRDRLEAELQRLGAVANATAATRVATVSNLSVRGRVGARLVPAFDLEGIACSSGAACSSGLDQPSPVLQAMYPAEPWRAQAALRFSFGPETTEIDVKSALVAAAIVLARGGAEQS